LDKQGHCNDLVLNLADDMACSVSYIRDVGQFATLPQLQEAIEDVIPLLEEAGDFIHEFYSHSTTWQSAFSSSTHNDVEGLTKKFNRFKELFDRGIAVQSGKALADLESLLASAKDDELLKELKLPGLERGSPINGCLEGTRGNILARIDEWVEDLNAPNILWLKGFPGAGKSAIASSLVERLRDSHRLGSSFFFERAKSNTTTVAALWRTVAFDLARLYPTVRKVIIANWEKVAVGAANTVDPHKLFRLLIEGSLESAKDSDVPIGRLPVVVIDALDECGGVGGENSDERQVLLETIESWMRLPARFKLVVTSRDEDDIRQALLHSQCIELPSGNSVSTESSADIKLFLQKQFSGKAKKYPDISPFTWQGVVDEFTTQAAGLFIWAQTVVKFMGGDDPVEQLKLIKDGVMKDSPSGMTDLYACILDNSFRKSGSDTRQAFRDIVGAIIVAKTPLSRSDCISLLSVKPNTFEFICSGLQSVMDTGDVLQFSHQSFVDFLISDEHSSGPFRIDMAKQHRTLAVNCLRVMTAGLRFNICKLVTSYVLNDESPNADEIAKNPIPTHLSYSCLFWGSHLRFTPFDIEVLEQLREFMNERFLYWLEVLSLIHGVHTATQTLSSVVEWCRVRPLAHDDDIVVVAKDGIKFLAVFGGPISQSVPHIYMSALPFAPSESKISKQFLHKFQGVLSLYTEKAPHWPAIQCVFEGHTGVNSVAFSQDGRRIVSGSEDNTIRVWDVETGVSQQFQGHTKGVTSVAFSNDGKRVVSGSSDETIRVWDAETGISQPFRGHTHEVTYVTFSQDDKHILSGSHDKTIRLWDTETGDVVLGPFKGHTGSVTSVAILLDGECACIVSSSDDGTIRVWDAETGLSQPFYVRNGVTSVAFSNDGKHIVCGLRNTTMWVWNTETTVAQEFHASGDTDAANSVAFSQDGKHIVSGSQDGTIRVWNAETGVSQQFQGHSGSVESVAFSKDGKRIVSGSSDDTIRVWDAETRDVVSGRRNEWHTDSVNSVAFSLDGKRIVSGSADNTIRVWDTCTGSAIPVVFEGRTTAVNYVSFSRSMVLGSWDATFQVWNAETGDKVSGPFKEEHSIFYVAFSQDGKHIASCSNRTIRVWNVSTGDLVSGPFEGHTGSVCSVVFSQDGKCVVSGSSDHRILVWDAATGNAVAGPYERHTGWVRSVAISQDGKRIVSGSDDNTIRNRPLWEAETPDVVSRPFEGHTAAVISVAISQDGKRIVSGSSDRTIRVWDAETGDVVSGPFKGHTEGVKSVAISQDGKYIVSGSYDKTIRVWNAETSDVISEISAMGLLQGMEVPPTSATSKLVDDFEMVDGWFVRSDSAKLLWVPPWNRIGLWCPRNTAVIAEDSTRLDFRRFVHGTSWAQCKTWKD
ncbi:WD40 repeat-like protein, partial [Rickenella mellea]